VKVTTELEKKLLGALGGFMAMASAQPECTGIVMRAAELNEEDVRAAFKNEANVRFNCTMWNLCNNAVGTAMLSHNEIEAKGRTT